MTTLLRRNTLFYNQLRQMHRSTGGSSVPTYNMNAEKKAFIDVLPEVINSAVTSPRLTELPEVQIWMKKLLEYTVGVGKLGRGLMTSIGYRMFEEPENFSEETQHSARVLGWCIEMMISNFLIMDDMADNSMTRRGQPCWHLQPNLSLNGVTDALLLYQSSLDVLDIYFGRTPIYGDLLRIFNEGVLPMNMNNFHYGTNSEIMKKNSCFIHFGQSSYRLAIGVQHLDFWSTYSKEKNNLDVFTMDVVNSIAINKSSHNTYKLPIFLPLLLVKNGKKKATEELSNICMDFGRLMQCQDDYLDIYVNDSVTGKTSRDIEEGKCTWVAVKALQHCNDAQRAIFKEYYGSKNPEHVKRIKQLYDELHIPQLYEQCERMIYDDLLRRIHALPAEGDRILLLGVLNATYKRIL